MTAPQPIKALMEQLWDGPQVWDPQRPNRFAQVRNGKVIRAGCLLPGVAYHDTNKLFERGMQSDRATP